VIIQHVKLQKEKNVVKNVLRILTNPIIIYAVHLNKFAILEAQLYAVQVQKYVMEQRV
jgi:hypothetical protein